jgi:hypothetical protein
VWDVFVFQREDPCGCGFHKTYQKVKFSGDFGENLANILGVRWRFRTVKCYMLQHDLQPVEQESFWLGILIVYNLKP